MLSLLSLLATCHSASAQGRYPGGPHYDVTYGGGTVTAVHGFTTPFAQSGTGSNPTYTGSGSADYGTRDAGSPGSCSVSVAGPLTAHFQWNNNGDATATSPASAIVTETSTVSWSGTAGGNATASGTLSSGMSGTPPANATSFTDYRYTVHGGDSFDVTCSPSAGFSGTTVNESDSYVYGNAGVTYSAVATPVVLTLNGTTKDTGRGDNILIGQGCSGTLSAGGFSLSNFQWTVPGQTFQSFNIASDQSSAQATPIPDYVWSDPYPHWTWCKDETVTVSSQADASINDTTIGRVSGQMSVKIWAPDYLFKPLSGPVSIDNRSRYLEIYAGGPHTGTPGSGGWDPPGMKNGGRVSTPNLFRLSPTGVTATGSWEFGQLIIPGRWLYNYDESGNSVITSLTWNGHDWNGQKVLDNDWPYPASVDSPAVPWPADSVDQSPQPNIPTYWMDDSPGNDITDYYYRERVDESFNDFMMYLPPNNGYGAEWVPLHLYTWKWQADVSRFGSWALGWTPHPPGYTSNISSARCTTHPQWNDKLTNSN